MANAYLDLIWRGQSVTAGTAQAKREIASVGDVAAGVWSKIGGLSGALSFVGVVASIQTVKTAMSDAVRGVQDWESAAQLTSGTLENLGYESEAAFGRVETAVQRVVDATRYGDDQVLSAANLLIEGTQDLEGSLRNLSLVADLATARNLDLASSAAIVAKVMEGNNRAVGQMLPFLRTYAESLEGIADPAERASMMLAKLLGAVGGKAVDELKTGRGAWLDYLDAVGESMEALVVKSGILPQITSQVRDLTRELNAMQQSDSDGELSGFDQKVVDAVLTAFPALAAMDHRNRRIQSGLSASGAGFGDLRSMDSEREIDKPYSPVLGPGNDEGASRFKQVVDEWSRAVDKWAFAIDPKFSDPRLPGSKYGSVEQRGEVRPLRLGGEDQRVRELDEDLLDPARKRMREIAQYAETSLASAIVAGGNAGWGGFLSSLKQTGLSALADLVAGAFANFILPGSSTGGILGPILGAFGLGGARADNLAARGAR